MMKYGSQLFWKLKIIFGYDWGRCKFNKIYENYFTRFYSASQQMANCLENLLQKNHKYMYRNVSMVGTSRHLVHIKFFYMANIFLVRVFYHLENSLTRLKKRTINTTKNIRNFSNRKLQERKQTDIWFINLI